MQASLEGETGYPGYGEINVVTLTESTVSCQMLSK